MAEEHQSAERETEESGTGRHDPDTVLIVDDDPGMCEALTTLLSDEGYHVAAACNGREALSYLTCHEAPCIILLDIMMPVMDGYTFCTQLCQHPALAAIPVVVLSAGAKSERILELCPAGFLRKPLDVNALLALVEEHC